MAGYQEYGLDAGLMIRPDYMPSFAELSEQYSEVCSPLLDQTSPRLKNLTPDQQHWRDYGYVIKRNFLPHDLIDEYVRLRDELGLLGHEVFPGQPHLYSSVIRDISCSRELHHLLTDLLGEEMGLQFSLNAFGSSGRGWHQDDYFNPQDSMGRHAAIWMAMGDIDPDSGPFEFVPGSHKWPCLRREKIWTWLKPGVAANGIEWMLASENFVVNAADEQIKATGSEVVQFDAKKGDILIWHSKLMHRGAIPKNQKLIRPSLICHYRSLRCWRDFSAEITRHGDGGYFWENSQIGEVLTEDKVARADATNRSVHSNAETTVMEAQIARLREMIEDHTSGAERFENELATLVQAAEESQAAFSEMRRAHEAALVKGWEEIQYLKRALSRGGVRKLLRRFTAGEARRS